MLIDENILFLINMNNLSDFDDEMICFLHFVINENMYGQVILGLILKLKKSNK